MEKLSFYDVVSKKKFMSTNWKTVVKKGRRFAVTKGPKGNMCWRVLGMAK